MKWLFTVLLSLVSILIFAQQKRPNVIIIISDDHALRSIGAYGSKFGASPNIDRLAKEGVTFDNAFVTNSLCAPSRAAMLTGKYSHLNGLRDNRDTFDASQAVFPKYLQQAGYQTAWIGKWHLKNYPQGFDYWEILPGQGQYYNPDLIHMNGDTLRYKGYCTDVVTDKAFAWMDKLDPSKPFCVVIGQKAPHRNWMPDTTDLGHYAKTRFPLPSNFYDNYEGREAARLQDMSVEKTMQLDNDLKLDISKGKRGAYATNRMDDAQWKRWNEYYGPIETDFRARNLQGRALTEWKYQRYMEDYLSTTLSLDRNVGRVLDRLKEKGLDENTIVIYTSDQGFYLGEHGWFDKRFMYEESVHMPFIMRYPGKTKAGTRNNQAVVNIDIGPTILAAAGLPVPPDMQGVSILPLLEGRQKNWRTATYYHYYEFPAEHSVRKHFGLRTERYKLIRFYGELNTWELYDLDKDPKEMKNLYGQKKYEELTREMKAELNKLVTQYKDTGAAEVLAGSE